MSKISICNVALASLGADAIRSFDETNKRARMCYVFFDSSRDYLLTKFNWPFARKYKKLQPLDMPDDEVPVGMFPYGIPADCKAVRDLAPSGSKDTWLVMGNVLYCKSPVDTTVAIYYTAQVMDTTLFSDTFSALLALAIAVRMAPAISQDKQLTSGLYSQFKTEQRDVWESDANIGNDYRAYDENPENDTFVNPDGWVIDDGTREGPYGDS